MAAGYRCAASDSRKVATALLEPSAPSSSCLIRSRGIVARGRQDTGGFEQSASFLPCTRGSGDPAQFTQSSAFDQQRFEPETS